MKPAGRIAIVVLLIAAVAAVFVLRRERAASEPAVPAASASLPRLVDLGSTTCVPCKLMAPILESLAEEYRGVLEVEFLDVRQDASLAPLYGIRVIPTQIFYDAAGQERFRHEGFMAKEDILAKWRELGVTLPQPASSRADG